MAGWLCGRRTLASGHTIRVIAWAVENLVSGPGCQAKIITGPGTFWIQGVEESDSTGKVINIVGKQPLDDYIALARDPFNGIPVMVHPDLVRGIGTLGFKEATDKLVVDILYEAQAKRYNVNHGAIVFSDRINRGTQISAGFLGKFGNATMSASGFAKYLSEHPECGTLFSSPIFHNPNHNTSSDWSLCQIWTFFPKCREGRYYVDEAQSIGIGPDTAKYKKDEVLKAYNSSFGRALTNEEFRVTYDEVG